MVIVLCELDGLNFGLFHGEQQTNWLYRWRLVGDLPSRYLEWREAKADSAFVKVQPELRGGTVEVEWRESEAAGWRQAALHVLIPHTVELEVTAGEVFALNRGRHSAIGPVRGHLARYFFDVEDPVEVLPDRPLRVTGHADAPVPANILFHQGEFTARDGAVTIRNVGVSADWSAPAEGAFTLTESPHLKTRKLFARS